MAQNYRQEHGVLYWTNGTGSDVDAGDVINIGPFVGIALVDIDNGDSGSVQITGVWQFAKDSSTISQADEVFWSVSGSQATTSPAADDPRLGIAALAAATGDSYVEVDINVPRVAGGVGSAIDSGTGDAAGNYAAIQSIITILENAGIANRG